MPGSEGILLRLGVHEWGEFPPVVGVSGFLIFDVGLLVGGK